MPPRKRRTMPASLEDPDSDWAPSGERRAPKPRAPKARKANGSGGAATAAPSPKKAKSPKQADPKPQPETRVGRYGQTVRWVPSPSSKVQDRIERALPGSGHRLYLIQREGRRGADDPGGPSEDFKVLGATGNVYDVTIGRYPSCSCPDFMQGNHPCKHVLFVLIRVLGVAQSNPLLWQRALLTAEADQVLVGSGRGGAAADRGGGGGGDVVASEAVRRRYAALTGGSVDDAAGGGGGGAAAAGQRAVEGDCPICFDALRGSREAISWCSSCGNNIHTECAKAWATHKRSSTSGAAVTCVYCRAPWADGAGLARGGGAAAAAAAAAVYGGGGYMNLAQFSEAHRGADTSLRALYPETSRWIDRRWRQGRSGGRYGSGRYGRRYEEEEEEEEDEDEESEEDDEGWGF